MKILSILFKNINSVEGENRVDFRRPPFADAGVFAITGPNGSGKSSILDAITLALYGETYRFDRPAMHVMTRHKADAYAEVEFEVGEQRYRSSWSVKREGDEASGRLLSPEMKLVCTTAADKVLADTQQTVISQISELTGMNFRNFTRSMMLAQGDFAAFLNALDNERLDILEKIISIDIYGDYKNKITEKASEARHTLELLDAEIVALNLFEPDKLEASEQDLADFTDQAEELKQQQATLTQQYEWLKRIASIEEQIIGLTEKQQKLRRELKAEQMRLDKIAAGQTALAYREDYTGIENSRRKIEETRLMLAAYRNELKQLQEKLAAAGDVATAGQSASAKSLEEQQSAIAAERENVGRYQLEKQSENNLLHSLIKQRDEKQALLDTVNAWLEAHAVDVNLLENFPETGKLKNLRARMVELDVNLKSSSKWVKNNRGSFEKGKAAVQKSTRKIGKLKLKLQIDEQKLEALARGRHADEIDEMLKDQQERLSNFKELYTIARAHARLTRGRFGLLGLGRAREEKSLADMRKELERYKDNLKLDENIRKTLEEAVANEALLARMAADRHLLEDNRPCPLCGSLDHPYARKPPASADSKRALADQRAKVQGIIAGIDRISVQIKTLEKQSEADQANVKRIAQLRAQWTTLCNRLNAVSEDMDINNTRKMKKMLRTEMTELRNINLLAKKYRLLQKNLGKVRQLIERHEALIRTLKADAENLDSQLQNRPQELEELEQSLKQCRLDEKALTAKVLEQLALVGEKMPGKGKEDAFFDRMNQRRQDYQSYALRRKNLMADLSVLADKISAGQTTVAELGQKFKVYSGRLQQEEFTGLHLALIEKQKLIAGQESLLVQQEQDADRLRRVLEQKLQGSSVKNADELAELLELSGRRPEIEQRLEILDTESANMEAELDRIRSRLTQEQTLALTEASEDEVYEQLHNAAEKIEITLAEIKYLEQVLGNQELIRRKYEVLSAKRTSQAEITRESEDEVKRMEEEQGTAFRRRVQVKVAHKLLAQANEVLEKISGRYYLRQIPSEFGLALEIEDTYQHNTRRLPKTLSGGESFVVSLALALALSDLAGNGRSVDSLFLDEGFGSLDAETLFIVISTLESLRTHGKKVGVISHVEAVKKRIKAQLQMDKKPNGMSYLKSIPDQEVLF